ncbi:prephenate dehydrogenase [Ketogulonicigenium vulgare]|uniref:prephenate dehydrogenase n=1 Tax=Ketogulonicigenium vulgare TaxID=92945 RepID=UPI002358E21B|nr:prephenate dehydrogenase [Ketogulonicigenium vulgare]
MFKKKVDIIGFGAFGRLLADLLKDHADIRICDPNDVAQAAAWSRGFDVIAAHELRGADFIILAMPLSAMAGVLAEISTHLEAGQTVVDVCSVKEQPVALMQGLLPDHISLLGTHPMFGPHSISAGTRGLQIVICPVRCPKWRSLARFLRLTFGFDIIVTTPEDHDEQAAMTQAMTHILSRAIGELGASTAIRTKSFDLMMEGFAMVRGDSPEVFDAVVNGNRHAKSVRDRLIQGLMRAF